VRTASFLLFIALALPGPARGGDIEDRYAADADRIVAAALADTAAFARLTEFVDRFPARLSGTDRLERGIDWILDGLRKDGLANVRGEPVTVPKWVRGSESARLVEPYDRNLPMLGLGGSVATPPDGVTAEVLVVSGFADLARRAADARGKIVVYDVPFTTYGETVKYRSSGADSASAAGGVAALVRSVTPFSLQTPHTGTLRYKDGVPRVPGAAITVEDAERLHRLQDLGLRPVVRLVMEAHDEPDAPSRNVMAELTGREKPEEIVIVSAHVDSWDVGQGAMDDAGGVVASWEAVRLLKSLGLIPRRTIRFVGWTNEENGMKGSSTYVVDHAYELDRTVLAVESDDGVFAPAAFTLEASDAAYDVVREIAGLTRAVGADSIWRSDQGTDIKGLQKKGVPGMTLWCGDPRYFRYHHSDADTIDKLDRGEFNRCVAALAVMIYVVADLEEPLPRAGVAAGR